MENNLKWKKTTSWIYRSLLVSYLMPAFLALFSTVAYIFAINELVVAIGVLTCAGISLVAGISYLVLLFLMRNLVSKEDSSAVLMVIVSWLLSFIVGAVTSLPIDSLVLAIVASVITIAVWVMLIIAYSKLTNSKTLSEDARQGMYELRASIILKFIAGAILVYPLIAIFIVSAESYILHTCASLVATWVVLFVSLCLEISGWKCVANSKAPAL